MNYVFISPAYPVTCTQFCDRLHQLGVNVLGIGDVPYDTLNGQLKNALTEYYYVHSLEDYNEVLYDVLQQAIQEKYNHELSFYFRKDRHRELVDVRHQVLYLYRFMSTESLMKMERRFGLHHATVLHSCECAENLRIFDSEFAKNYEELSSKINAKLEQL